MKPYPGQAVSVGHAVQRQRHVARVESHQIVSDVFRPEPSVEPDATPELAAAWHSLQLYWLDTVPGYREQLRERVSAAAKRAEEKLKRMEAQEGRSRRNRPDVDTIGPPSDPCG